MTTPNSIVQHLLQLGRDLEQLTRDLAGSEREAVTAREALTLAFAKAFLCAEGAVDVRKNTALVETHSERLQSELADAEVRNCRARIASIKARVDIGRTAASTLRSELELDRVAR